MFLLFNWFNDSLVEMKITQQKSQDFISFNILLLSLKNNNNNDGENEWVKSDKVKVRIKSKITFSCKKGQLYKIKKKKTTNSNVL